MLGSTGNSSWAADLPSYTGKFVGNDLLMWCVDVGGNGWRGSKRVGSQPLTTDDQMGMMQGCYGNVALETKIELFDNREWNQNVRGELVLAHQF